MSEEELTRFSEIFKRWQAGDTDAANELFKGVRSQFIALAHRRLAGFPGVRRWEETDDVFQSAMLRLWASMQADRLNDFRHFLATCATSIRHQLLDLKKHYYGPRGSGAHHATASGGSDDDGKSGAAEPALGGPGPRTISGTREMADRLEEAIDRLPDKLRLPLELTEYQGLTLEAVARHLDIDERTVRRQIIQAKVKLKELLPPL